MTNPPRDRPLGVSREPEDNGVGGDGHDARPTPDHAIDRVDYDPGYDPGSPVQCEVCGETMYYTAACKLKCPRCGYTRDCSDP